MKNINKLKSKEFEDIVKEIENNSNFEESLIEENKGNLQSILFPDNLAFVKQLLQSLSAEKQEGERVIDFDERIKKNFFAIIGNECKENI